MSECVANNKLEEAMELTRQSTNGMHKEIDLQRYRQHTHNELLLLDAVALNDLSINTIPQFSLCPLELRDAINKVGIYYQWFTIAKKKLSPEDIRNSLSLDVRHSLFTDGLEYQNINDDITRVSRHEVFNESKRDFYDHVVKNIFDEDEATKHLPVPVNFYTKPTLPVPFLIHILLSMGRFSTELDLFMHTSLGESLHYTQLIGPSDEEFDLQGYSNGLLKCFIEEQMIYCPNSLGVVCDMIFAVGEVFDNVIVHNNIPVSDLPPIQHSTLYFEIDAEITEYRA
eukprot:15303310-Ditylum_brightwellii.AAC.2